MTIGASSQTWWTTTEAAAPFGGTLSPLAATGATLAGGISKNLANSKQVANVAAYALSVLRNKQFADVRFRERSFDFHFAGAANP